MALNGSTERRASKFVPVSRFVEAMHLFPFLIHFYSPAFAKPFPTACRLF